MKWVLKHPYRTPYIHASVVFTKSWRSNSTESSLMSINCFKLKSTETSSWITCLIREHETKSRQSGAVANWKVSRCGTFGTNITKTGKKRIRTGKVVTERTTCYCRRRLWCSLIYIRDWTLTYQQVSTICWSHLGVCTLRQVSRWNYVKHFRRQDLRSNRPQEASWVQSNWGSHSNRLHKRARYDKIDSGARLRTDSMLGSLHAHLHFFPQVPRKDLGTLKSCEPNGLLNYFKKL